MSDLVVVRLHQAMTPVSLPEDLDFSDLHLARDPDGNVSFDWRVVERICAFNRLPVELFRDAPEDIVSGLIVAWYHAHRQLGGPADPVAEDLIAEVVHEENAGQSASHRPGRS